MRHITLLCVIKKTLKKSYFLTVLQNKSMKKMIHFAARARNACLVQKILLTMKLTTFLLLFAVIQTMGFESFSQGTKISLIFKNTSLKEVLGSIEDKTEYYFLYSSKVIDVDRKIDVDINGKSISETLDQILKDTDIEYVFKDRQILLSNKSNQNKLFENSQQQKSVSGKVTDSSGAPLPGVSVVIKGTTTGIITDSNGNYKLSNIQPNSIIQFSFVGMKIQEIEPKEKTVLNVTLMEVTVDIEEVVAVGYGTMKKSDIVGAISSVKSNELSKIAAPSVATMLQGKAAGLVINSTSAQPGGGFSFNIRGLASTGIGNEPLVIVDGFPISNSNTDPTANSFYTTGFKNTSLTSFNPEDIESIEVLKDASATAIYGARAGHGVILIKTKRGISGKTQIEYSSSVTIQQLMDKPEVLDGPDYMRQTNRFLYEQYLSQNKIFPYGTKMKSEITTTFNPRYNEEQINNAVTTDWFDLITTNGMLQQHNLSIKGGNSDTKYLISFSSYNHDGTIKGNSFDRYTGRINLDQKIGKYINGGVSFMMSSITNDNYAGATTSNLSDRGVITNALWFSPALPVKDNEGKYNLNPNYPNMPNPVSLLEITDITNTNRYLANSYLQIDPIKGLSIKGTIGFDNQIGQGNSYLPTTTLYGIRENGRADKTYQKNFSWQYDFTLTYNKTLAENHNFSLLLGYSQQEFKNDYFRAGNANFLTDTYLYNNLAQGTLERPIVSSNAGKSSIAGYFSRFAYNFKSKYYLTATVRRDGSSDFAENNKWGNFPSFALAWRIDQESFMKSAEFLSQLKLRASWGQTGNAGLGGRAKAYYGNSGNYIFGPGGGTIHTGVRLIQLANSNLKWETTTEKNFGIDAGLLDNKISMSVEYFHRVISDLLSTKSLPSYLELSSVAANVGKTQSNGMEFTLNTMNINKANFKWNTTFTLSYYIDRWKDRDPSWVPNAWENVDDPIRKNTGYLDDGLIEIGDNTPWILNPLPGTRKTRDIDGFLRDESGNIIFDDLGRGIKTGKPDGQMDNADVVIRFVDKPFYLGLNNKIQYKIFDLSIYLYGVLNRIGVDPNQATAGSALTTESINQQEAVKNVWTHDNPNGSPWDRHNSFTRKIGFSGIQNMAFIRVKDLNFGINVPKNKLPEFISGFRAYAAVSNLWVFSQYTGWDPETDWGTGSYPNPRNYTFGININF